MAKKAALMGLFTGVFSFVIFALGDHIAPGVFVGQSISNYIAIGIVGGISAVLASLVVKLFK